MKNCIEKELEKILVFFEPVYDEFVEKVKKDAKEAGIDLDKMKSHLKKTSRKIFTKATKKKAKKKKATKKKATKKKATKKKVTKKKVTKKKATKKKVTKKKK